MGNNMTVTWSEQLKHQFTLVETSFEHRALGQIDIYQYIPDENVQIFRKFVTIDSQDYFEKRVKLHHHGILRAIAQEQPQTSCGINKDIYNIYFDYPGVQTLEDVLLNKSNLFKEDSIWDFIFQIVDSADYLQQHYISIGNLNLNTIYVKQDGIKLLDVNPLLRINSSYNQALNNQIAILSPEQIESLQKNIQIPEINQFKSDLYALGIILLCMTSKKLFTQFYNNKNELNKNQIFEALQFTQNNYSELLYGLIQKILIENPTERQNWKDIKKFIDPFKLLKDQPFYQDLRLCPKIDTQKIKPQNLNQISQHQQIQQPLAIQQSVIPITKTNQFNIQQNGPNITFIPLPQVSTKSQQQQIQNIAVQQQQFSQQNFYSSSNYNSPQVQQSQQMNQQYLTQPSMPPRSQPPQSLPPQSVPSYQFTSNNPNSMQPTQDNNSFEHKKF